MSQPDPAAELVRRIIAGQAPLAVRQVAARGAVPLPRTALVQVFVHLLDDADEGVRLAANASLQAMTHDSVVGVLGDADCAPEVLRHFAPRAARDASLAERLAFHAATPIDALGILAGEGSATVVDLVLTNEERLLASPVLLDRLTVNAALRADQRGRILDILERLSREASRHVATDGADEGIPENLDPEEVARLLEVELGDLFAASEILGGDELEKHTDFVVRSTYKRILKLSPGQKAMLAMKGGRDARLILIRDTNKVVALSVLKNPRISEMDIEEISRMRNVTEEVLRTIGANREWSKRYSVTLQLVRNPKTPQSISVNFISRLAVKDLKDLSRDKNIPELVRRIAKRTYDQRSQKAASNKKQ